MSGKKVLVAGCGISGIGAAGMLLSAGEEVILYDSRTTVDREAVAAKTGAGKAPEIVLGELTDDVIARTSYCVISPGIPTSAPFVRKLADAGIRIESEIELAYRYEKGCVIGITGTNGKTTTTSLTGAIIAEHFGADKTFVVGNIGTAYTGSALSTKPDTITVAEISSFQLETSITFRPHVCAILNITPDHLDRHGSMENYIAAKEKIAGNQTKEDFCVLNADDAVLMDYAASCPARVVLFSSRKELEEGFFMRGDELLYRFDGVTESIGHTGEFQLVGRCNYENILAASAIAVCMGVPAEVIRRCVREFKPVEHRIEYTATKKGVRYYNDSKGTNPDAAIQGIRAMTTPTCLIGGGYDKHSDYSDWIREFGGKVKYLVLIGATARDIAACCDRMGFSDYEFAESLDEAVSLCARHALPGEAVLLSPACASWGMFDNYEQRGRMFKDLVRALPD